VLNKPGADLLEIAGKIELRDRPAVPGAGPQWFTGLEMSTPIISDLPMRFDRYAGAAVFAPASLSIALVRTGVLGLDLLG
jgi:hypothetical protein